MWGQVFLSIFGHSRQLCIIVVGDIIINILRAGFSMIFPFHNILWQRFVANSATDIIHVKYMHTKNECSASADLVILVVYQN